jgi:uncharacterized protein YecA (UPF0149 family)
VPEGETAGESAVLDVGPEESPQPGAEVRAEPTVKIGGRTVRNVVPAGVIGAGAAAGGGAKGEWGNVGRNDPCPCGSGKKFKKCHGVGT